MSFTYYIIRECHFEEFDSDLSTETICNWSNFIRYFYNYVCFVCFICDLNNPDWSNIREVCMVWLDEKFEQQGKIGGPGIVIVWLRDIGF
jgi:hypothetical protein